MKKILFIFALSVIGCSTDQDNCGKVEGKTIEYNNKNGMYIYKVKINGGYIVVSESKYKSTSKGDYVCE